MLSGGVFTVFTETRRPVKKKPTHRSRGFVRGLLVFEALPPVGTPTQSHCELNREQQTENQQQHTMRDESISIQKLFTEAPAAAAAAEAANHSALPTRDH